MKVPPEEQIFVVFQSVNSTVLFDKMPEMLSENIIFGIANMLVKYSIDLDRVNILSVLLLDFISFHCLILLTFHDITFHAEYI